MVTVFDISQTDGTEDNKTEAITDPDVVLRDSFITQLKRLGYTLTIMINKEIRTVTLSQSVGRDSQNAAGVKITTENA
ncbi:MAG: hypothetical protein JO272_04080 [Pseudonocardiales bacterium]|nr:hypothetical protein [Pseudonocardiales bacterium]